MVTVTIIYTLNNDTVPGHRKMKTIFLWLGYKETHRITQ